MSTRLTISLLMLSVLVLVAAFLYTIHVDRRFGNLALRRWLGEEAKRMRAQTWFNDPRAVSADGDLYVGFTNMWGAVGVELRDISGSINASVTLGTIGARADDHANPALYVRPDGRLVAAWGEHTGALTVAISKEPYEIAAWDTARIGTGDYAYAHLIPVGTDLFLFTRRHVGPHTVREGLQTVRKSADHGATWGEERELIAEPGEVPYLKAAPSAAGGVHLAFTDGHPDWLASSIFYAHYQNNELAHVDGSFINESVPIRPASASEVWNAGETGQRSWIWDILDAKGKPILAFVTFEGGVPDSVSEKGGVGDHGRATYRVAQWNGQAWHIEAVSEAGAALYDGEPAYSGGIALIAADSVLVSHVSGGVPNLWLFVRTRDGWVGDSLGIAGFRPYAVRTRGGEVRAWGVISGTYRAYTNFETSLEIRKWPPQ